MNLDRLLNPDSICVIGGKEAAEVIRQCLRMSYSGPIYPVHPTRSEIHGIPCFAHLQDLPQAPDAAFIGIRRELTPQALKFLAAMGAGGALCYASGFSEIGSEGQEMQHALLEAAGDMPFLGPNCYGFINYFDDVPIWPDEHGGKRVERGVAVICQSSNIALNLTMQRRALPIGMLVTLGNRAKLGTADLVDSMLDDDRISAIGLVIETLDDAEKLARATHKASQLGVPIVALKLGRSKSGADLTLTHTASLAGEDAACQAFLKHIGIASVASIPALLEALKLLHLGGPVGGNQLVSMSCSGGEAALMADAIARRKLHARSFQEEEERRIASTLNELATVSNPLDYHTFIWEDLDRLRTCFSEVLSCQFDISLLVLDLPRDDLCDEKPWHISLQAFAQACKATKARGCVLSTIPECMTESLAQNIIDLGLTPLIGVEDSLDAIEALALVSGSPLEGQTPIPALQQGAQTSLSEWQSKQTLASYGLAVPQGALASSLDQAKRIAETLEKPLVIKSSGPAFAHKTELNALRLNLRSNAEIESAVNDLFALSEEVLVEEMIADGIAEIIIGIRRDPQVGLTLVLAAGGELTELFADQVVLILPCSRPTIELAITELKLWKLLSGFRGSPAGDVDALLDIVMNVQRFAIENAAHLIELDVNPVIVRPRGAGAVAADALLIIAGETVKEPES